MTLEDTTLSLEGPCIADHDSAQILREKIEIRSWILRQSKRPVRTVHEPFSTERAQQVREVIFRRTPDPREIPEHTPLLFGSEPPVHFLDQISARTSDD